jgi:hypothetical protein
MSNATVDDVDDQQFSLNSVRLVSMRAQCVQVVVAFTRLRRHVGDVSLRVAAAGYRIGFF